MSYSSTGIDAAGRRGTQDGPMDEPAGGPRIRGDAIRLLVVDDEEPIRLKLAEWLGELGYDCGIAAHGEEALERLDAHDYDLVLTDLKMPKLDGFGLLRAIAERPGETEVVVFTGYGSVETAVEAMKLGARDFILKPIEYDQMARVVENAADRVRLRNENQRLSDENQSLRRMLDSGASDLGIVGQSEPMREVFARIENLADTSATALVLGETGTGKELVARAIHRSSTRRDEPFVAINVNAVPETLLESELFGHERGAFTGAIARRRGCFERADQGTLLFLDEVGDLPRHLQAKLLRVLETQTFERVGGEESIQVDVRIVAATNRDLESAMASGDYREDLYYRLNVFPIRLPPLRERLEDLPLLIDHFLKRHARRIGREVTSVHPEVLARLASHPWPGNVRQLENVIERSLIVCQGRVLDEVLLDDRGLQASFADGAARTGPTGDPDLGTLKVFRDRAAEQAERIYLQRVLREEKGHLGRTAAKAGIDAKTLYRRMKRFDLRKEDFKH